MEIGQGFEPWGHPVKTPDGFQGHCNKPDSANLPIFYSLLLSNASLICSAKYKYALLQ